MKPPTVIKRLAIMPRFAEWLGASESIGTSNQAPRRLWRQCQAGPGALPLALLGVTVAANGDLERFFRPPVH